MTGAVAGGEVFRALPLRWVGVKPGVEVRLLPAGIAELLVQLGVDGRVPQGRFDACEPGPDGGFVVSRQWAAVFG